MKRIFFIGAIGFALRLRPPDQRVLLLSYIQVLQEHRRGDGECASSEVVHDYNEHDQADQPTAQALNFRH